MCVRESRVAQHGASGLDGLYDLLAVVGGEREPRRARVQLHGAPQRLLRALRHAVRLIQDHDLVPPRRQRDLRASQHISLTPFIYIYIRHNHKIFITLYLLLCKHFDLVPDDIDTTVVGSVELEHGVAERGAEQSSCQA